MSKKIFKITARRPLWTFLGRAVLGCYGTELNCCVSSERRLKPGPTRGGVQKAHRTWARLALGFRRLKVRASVIKPPKITTATKGCNQGVRFPPKMLKHLHCNF